MEWTAHESPIPAELTAFIEGHFDDIPEGWTDVAVVSGREEEVECVVFYNRGMDAWGLITAWKDTHDINDRDKLSAEALLNSIDYLFEVEGADFLQCTMPYTPGGDAAARLWDTTVGKPIDVNLTRHGNLTKEEWYDGVRDHMEGVTQ